MYLLDTSVVCELRKRPGSINARVASWGAANAASDQYLSVVTLFEVDLGILLVERRDPARGRLLRTWFDSALLGIFARRTFAIDTDVARTAAGLHVPDPRPERDAFIAATALVHGLTVATRNTADFQPMGVPVVNPWA